ncbi:glycosyltransferase, partial [bacterium]|nr:glycosyltransferase [bacterium]
MKQLSILQISTASGLGGGERVLVDLCHGLAERGHHVGAVVRAKSPLIDRFENDQIEIVLMAKRRGAHLLLARKLAKRIDAGAWQLINAHTPPDYLFAALARRLSTSKPRLVFTRHILLPLG